MEFTLSRQHRRLVVGRRRSTEGELAFTEEMLRNDAKNYHVWAHRQWLTEEFAEWDAEFDFINRAWVQQQLTSLQEP